MNEGSEATYGRVTPGLVRSRNALWVVGLDQRGNQYPASGQLNQQIHGYEAQIDALQRQQALIAPELEGVRKLWKRGLVTINRLNQLERTAVDMDGSIASLRATIAQTRAQIAETREQMINTRQTVRSEAAAGLTQLLEVLNNQQVQSASAADQLQRSAVVSPAAGIVDKLAVNAPGDVVRPAEPILTIVPTGDDLVVEASVSPMDIDRVSLGQAARLHFSSLNAQTTPELPGKVVSVGAERTVDERTGAQYFQVRVRIDPAAQANSRLPLRPGMPVEVFISTGSRSHAVLPHQTAARPTVTGLQRLIGGECSLSWWGAPRPAR